MFYNKAKMPFHAQVATAINSVDDIVVHKSFLPPQTNLQTKHTQPTSEAAKVRRHNRLAISSHTRWVGSRWDGVNKSILPGIVFPANFERTHILWYMLTGLTYHSTIYVSLPLAGLTPIKKKVRRGPSAVDYASKRHRRGCSVLVRHALIFKLLF